MNPGVLRVRGAREHNLRAVDLDLPRGRLTVLCGPSGSGKTSLAFDVLVAEGQRRYLEAMALRETLPAPPRVDAITGLPPTLALAQRGGAVHARSTVGTLSETDPMLRVLFGRCGELRCPRCGARVAPVSQDEIVARLLALPVGARLLLETPVRAGDPAVLEEIGRAGFGRVRVDDDVLRVEEVKAGQLARAKRVRVVVDRIRIEPDRRARLHDSVRLAVRAGRGVVVAVHDHGEEAFVERPYCAVDDLELPPLEPELFGGELGEAARAARWRGLGIAELRASRLDGLRFDPGVGEVERLALAELDRRVRRLVGLGLGHLALDRPASTLSTSEIRRLRLARTAAAPLAGVAYVVDEPAAGLDGPTAAKVAALLRELVDAGNTVIAVEHHPEVLRAADHLVEFGPGAGLEGGRVIAEATPAALAELDTPTGRFLAGKVRAAPRALPAPTASATLSGPWCHGRPAPALVLPRQRLVAVTGPSGSGKSAFVAAVAAALAEGSPTAGALTGAEGLARLVAVERAAGKGARASVATYVGAWEVLRDLLSQTADAQVRALGASSFSLTGPGGRCEACRGTGELWIELGPLPDVVQTCPVCRGARFQADVLEVRWKGANAAELLALDGRAALALLAGHPKLEGALRALVRAGLGYVPLGQSLTSLSGGEARRLAIARELARAARRGGDDVLVLLDDPTVGLHPEDVVALVGLFRELVGEGSTVWCATADPLLVDAADAVVALPPLPEGGSPVVFHPA